jgi:serine/threonine protein kinase/tetratricopeptide (TPR) repeat protein
MNRKLLARARKIFAAALEEPRSRRRAYVDTATEDAPALRARIYELLQAQEESAEFLLSALEEESAQDLQTAVAEAAQGADETISYAHSIDRYQLRKLLGKGGMGEVWLADQLEPLRRQVAVKVIKQGMDTREVIARFDAERQALALMDHPHIARVLDAGATAAGRPYFVMEWVQGAPITEYCERAKLSIRQRVELLGNTCEAVLHAHQKGVIHRDLKPSNVLVTQQEGVPIPKVIDFGIAKAIRGRLTKQTLRTGDRQLLGTPDYMSPEQAVAGGDDLDTRTDVYSLGVLLYEVLAGVHPFRDQDRSTPEPEELLRWIRERDPPRLSTQVAPSLARHLRGDLDWIVLKALEKERSRRYQSVGALASDLRRYLRQEPVTATPPTWSYRLSKYVRRHRFAAFAAALVLATGIVALSSLLYSYFQVRSERDQKSAALNSTEQTVRLMEHILGPLDLADVKQGRFSIEKAMASWGQRLDALPIENPAIEARIRNTMGLVFGQFQAKDLAIQNLTRASTLHEEALGATHPLTLETWHGLGTVLWQFGEIDAAEVNLRRALEGRRGSLGPKHESTLSTTANLGMLLSELGRFDEAESLLRLAVQHFPEAAGGSARQTRVAMLNLGLCLKDQGKHEEGEHWLKNATDANRQLLGEDHPDTLQSMTALGSSLRTRGRFSEAEPLLRNATEGYRRRFGDQHPDTLTALHGLALMYHDQRQLDAAEPLYREVVRGRRQRFGAHSKDALISSINLAAVLIDREKLDEAEDLLRESMQYCGAQPDTLKSTQLHAQSILGMLLRKANRVEEAEPLLHQTLKELEEVFGPAHHRTHAELGALARLLHGTKRNGEARTLVLENRRRVQDALGLDHPDALHVQNRLGWMLHHDLGADQEAEEVLRDVLLRERRVLGDQHPSTIGSINRLARLLEVTGREHEAESLYREALSHRRTILGDDHRSTLVSLNNLGNLLKDSDRPEGAEEVLHEAWVGFANLDPPHPDTPTVIYNYVGAARKVLQQRRQELGAQHPQTLEVLLRLARALATQRSPQAEEHYRQASEIQRQQGDLEGYQESAWLRCNLLLQAQRAPEAEELSRDCLELLDAGNAPPPLWRARHLITLGAALCAQSEGDLDLLVEAESYLLEGLEESTEEVDRHRALEQLVSLYESWHPHEPEAGHAQTASELRARLRPSSPGNSPPSPKN